MTLCTFYTPLGKPDDEKVIELWKAAWSRVGFDRIMVLDGLDAALHPRFGEVLKNVQRFPTLNQRDYEDACYVRWCAASRAAEEHGKIWFMDYDVFPTENWEGWPPQTFCATFGHTPSCICGRKKDFEKIIRHIATYEPDESEKHVSDMMILHDRCHFDSAWAWLQNYGELNWRDKPIIHFGNSYMPKDVIRSELIAGMLKNGLISVQ